MDSIFFLISFIFNMRIFFLILRKIEERSDHFGINRTEEIPGNIRLIR